MRYVVEVINNGGPEVGHIIGMYDAEGEDTDDPRETFSIAVETSRGTIVLPVDAVPIYSVH